MPNIENRSTENNLYNARPMETVTGVLERVTYHNEENGYTVARIAVEGARDLVTVVGNFSNPIVGEMLVCEGTWTAHREFGRQLTVERYLTSKPATAFAIEKYLGSGLIKGVGPVMAKRMVDLFGLDTLDIIEREARKLLRVEGIGEKRVAMIQRAWDEQREIRNVMLFLQEKGVSATYAVKIYKTYGDKAIATVEANPYRLAQDIWGIGFKTADKIAQQMGVAVDSEQRIEAGLLHTLSEATDFGHLYLPEPKLLTSAEAILSVETEKIAPVLEKMADAQTILAEDLPEIEMAGRAMRAFYHPALYYTEVGLASQLRRRLELPLPKPLSREKIGLWITKQEASQNIALSDEQKEAVSLALENRVFILTGGPGTGKCVHGNSLVLSAKGIAPIQTHWEMIVPTEKIAGTFAPYRAEIMSKEGLTPTSHIYYGGMQTTWCLHSSLGLELEGTPNHRIWGMTETGPDWMRLDELKAGDYIAVRRGDRIWGENSLDPEVGYLFGVISGDGSQASPNGIRITNNLLPLLERCQQTIKTHYGVNSFVVKSRNTYELRIDNTAFRRKLLEDLPVCKSEGKTIPAPILQSPETVVVEYLAGLFDTDGHIQSRSSGQICFEITLKSRVLIQQVQILLLNLGIISRVAMKKMNYQYREKPVEERTYWRLSVFGHDVDKLIETIPTSKAVVAQKRVCNTNRDIVPLPGNLIRELFTHSGRRSRREWWALKREIAGNRKPIRRRLLELMAQRQITTTFEKVSIIHEACRDCYFWDKVAALEKSCSPVYDLTVPEAESFIANGFVNHNTTVSNTIVKGYEAQKKRILLVSPTGRAAKRLSEVTGRDAQTIHRLLKFDPATHAFQYNETNPLSCDVLIADEVSMLDAVLANNLLKAVPLDAQIIFVGDSDQLPSVGAGNVLGDMLDSGVIPSIRLSQVFRQAQESLIVTNAHRIRKGEFPMLVPPKERGGQNCLWIDVDEGATDELPSSTIGAQQIVKLARKTLPALGYRKDDIQVLTAMRRGGLGVDYLNELLQEALNPADPMGRRPEFSRGSRKFRIGDRVLQLVNNYDKNVFNGDVGVVADIKPDDQLLVIRYPETLVEYDYADYDELQLAYTMSIHKSQGSEYPAVILVVHSSQYMMLQRNLLYTGLTRARNLCLLVADKRAIGTAVRNNKTTKRYTRLAERLHENGSTE